MKQKRKKITDRYDLLTIDHHDFTGGTILLTYFIDEYGWICQLEDSYNSDEPYFTPLWSIETIINELSNKNAKYIYNILKKRLNKEENK